MWAILAAATLGLDVGWQPLPDGGFEYIIQIEPETLESLKNGEDLRSEIPPFLRGVRSYRITVGNAPLPHEGEPPPVTVPGPDDAATDTSSAIGTTAMKVQASSQPPYNYGQPNYTPGRAPTYNPSAPATNPATGQPNYPAMTPPSNSPTPAPRYAPAPTYVQPNYPAGNPAGNPAVTAGPASSFAAPSSSTTAPANGSTASPGDAFTPRGGFAAPVNDAANSLEQATKDAAAKAQDAINSVKEQTQGLLKNLPEPPGYETPSATSGTTPGGRYDVPPGQTPVTHDSTAPGSAPPIRGRGADEMETAPAGATSPGTGGFAYPGAPPSIRSQAPAAAGNERRNSGAVSSAPAIEPRASETTPLDTRASDGRMSTYSDRTGSDRSGSERTTADKVNADRAGTERSSSGSTADDYSSRSGKSDDSSLKSKEESRPWMPLIGAVLALFASMGANIYLGWNTLALRNRYRDLVLQLHAS